MILSGMVLLCTQWVILSIIHLFMKCLYPREAPSHQPEAGQVQLDAALRINYFTCCCMSEGPHQRSKAKSLLIQLCNMSHTFPYYHDNNTLSLFIHTGE